MEKTRLNFFFVEAQFQGVKYIKSLWVNRKHHSPLPQQHSQRYSVDIFWLLAPQNLSAHCLYCPYGYRPTVRAVFESRHQLLLNQRWIVLILRNQLGCFDRLNLRVPETPEEKANKVCHPDVCINSYTACNASSSFLFADIATLISARRSFYLVMKPFDAKCEVIKRTSSMMEPTSSACTKASKCQSLAHLAIDLSESESEARPLPLTVDSMLEERPFEILAISRKTKSRVWS